MAEIENGYPNESTSAQDRQKPAAPPRVRSSTLKYYIHDGVDNFRLQLIGELAEQDVPELTGCWNTARTILVNRKLVLDLTQLKRTDEAGREWLLSMVREGATSIPESYFRDHLANVVERDNQTRAAPNNLSRLTNAFRGSRDIGVEGSTRAR